MVCVVCQQPIRDAHYANNWENVRKLSPCCSVACASQFDSDVHWLPAVAPTPVTGEEELRLVKVARTRAAGGDHPTVVVREVLIAGVSVIALRKILHDAGRAVSSADRTVNRLGVFGAFAALITRRWRMYERRGGAEPALLASAAKELEVWRAHFAPTEP